MTLGPDYVAPEPELPDEWRNAVESELYGEDSPLQDWWHNLNDPILDELIDRVVAENLDVQIAISRVEVAWSTVGVIAGKRRPQSDFGASFNRNQTSDTTNPGPSGNGLGPTNTYSSGFGAFWEIDVFGRIKRQIESATAEYEASIEEYRDVIVILMAEVASAYVDTRTLQTRLEYAYGNERTQSETLALTESRFEAGITSVLDVTRAESNLAVTRAQIPSLQLFLEVAMNRIAILLAEPPGAVHDLLIEPKPIPVPVEHLAVGLPAELIRRRPDIRASERLLNAQTARIYAAKGELYPKFSLAGLLMLESPSSGNFLDSDSVAWSFTPGLTWNVTSGGSIRSQIDIEEFLTEQALLNYENAVLVALGEVENALVSYELDSVRQDHLAEAVDATQRTVDVVLAQYASGLADFEIVLDAERSLFNQQDQLATSQGQVVQDLINLNRSLGGGWDSEISRSNLEALAAQDGMTE